MIAAFIADRMTSYLAGGMKPESTAQFTRRELLAIYTGDHRSRDTSGAFRVTSPPEALDIKAAMRKANAAIIGILKCCVEDAKTRTQAPNSTPRDIDSPSGAGKKNGLEGLKNYVNRIPT